MKAKGNEITKGILGAIFVILIVSLSVWFLYSIKIVLAYMVIAAVLALMCSPLVKLFEKTRIPNVISVFLTMIMLLSVAAFLVSLFIPLVISQAENLSLLDTKNLEDQISHWIRQIDLFLSHYGIKILKELNASGMFSAKHLTYVPDAINTIFSLLGDLVIGLLSVLFITFFFLLDNSTMTRPIYALVPDEYELRLKQSLNKIRKLLSRYFLGLFFQVLILFVLYSVILLIFSVDNFLIISLLCALLNLIPYIGPLVGALLMVSLTMTGMIGTELSDEVISKVTYILICYLVVQLIDNVVNQPLIFSKSVVASPLEIFINILVFGTLFGVLGMIVAIPTYTAIKVILKEFFSEFKLVKML